MYRLKNGESIDCKVISLKKDYYRRKKFFYQKNSEFFEIFDAATPELNRNLNLFDEIAFEKFYLRKPLPGEIGCTLNHYLVLREYVESESSTPFILVAEDDAIFQDNLFDVIEECADYLPSKGVAILGRPHSVDGAYNFFGWDEHAVQISMFSRIVGDAPRGKYRLGVYRGEVWGSGLYLMTREAARGYVNYVQRIEKIHWVADHWDYYKAPSFINVMVLQPSLCGFLNDSTIREVAPSSIGANKRGKSRGIRGDYNSAFRELQTYLALRTRVKRLRWGAAATLLDLGARLGRR